MPAQQSARLVRNGAQGAHSFLRASQAQWRTNRRCIKERSLRVGWGSRATRFIILGGVGERTEEPSQRESSHPPRALSTHLIPARSSSERSERTLTPKLVFLRGSESAKRICASGGLRGLEGMPCGGGEGAAGKRMYGSGGEWVIHHVWYFIC